MPQEDCDAGKLQLKERINCGALQGDDPAISELAFLSSSSGLWRQEIDAADLSWTY